MKKAFISPKMYVQGEGELSNLGLYVKMFGDTALVIGSKGDVERVQEQLKSTEKKYGITLCYSDFGGESSRGEVKRLQEVAKSKNCVSIIGLGGGKAIDTAKCVAEGKTPLIIAPTIAATDAPTSHSAVLYHDDGSFDDYAYFKSPDVVLVDTDIIAKAPVRFLVAGMGDALATYFETRACAKSFANVNAGGQSGGAIGTKTAMIMSEYCYSILLEDGYKAKLACESKGVTQALENIVEANILLSGLGFESGGLAAAHAIHNGFTEIEEAHEFYHGEKVAFGTICQLVLENADLDEIEEVIDFCKSVGLPTCLADFGIEKLSDELLKKVAEKSCAEGESVYNMPFKVTPADVAAAILTADKLGSY